MIKKDTSQTYSFTYKNFTIMKKIVYLALFLCFLFSNLTAQIPLDTVALLQERAKYLKQADSLFALLPKRETRGLYVGTSLMLVNMPEDAIRMWYIAKTCDCTGKVIRIDSLDDNYNPAWASLTAALNVEWHPSNRLSFSLAGYKTGFSLDSGRLVYANNNQRSSLREPFKMVQYVVQSSAKFYFNSYMYLGGGVTWSKIKIQGALTNTLQNQALQNQTETPPQYESVAIDKKKLKNHQWTPNAYVGVKSAIFDSNWQIAAELGLQRKTLYGAIQLLAPISPNILKSNRQYRAAYRRYQYPLYQAMSIEYRLYPERFPSENYNSDSGGSDGGSSGGDSGGGSSGGCGGNN
jgi:uncharacterized membrane protein YgcG